MKKIFTFLTISLIPLFLLGQGWPAGYGGVMLQGFFWDSYLENPDFGPNGTQQQRDQGHITMVPHTNPWGANIQHTWATMYGAGWTSGTEDWEVPMTTWANMERSKDFVAPFIDLLWLPQSGATIAPANIPFSGSSVQTREMRNGVYWNFNPGDYISNPDCNGFVPYLWFDHGRGEHYTYYVNGIAQDYTSMTYFGTEAELKSMIAAYKAMGTGAIEDVVINHKGFAGDFWFQEDYRDPETGSMTNTNWTRDDLVGLVFRNGQWTNWYMPLDGSGQEKQITGGGTGKDDGDYGGWANEVAHTSQNAQRNTVNYLKYLKDELGYVGFRYDYAKGLAPGRFAQYNMTTTPLFSVGENWDSYDVVAPWIKNTSADGHIQSAAFDFELMYAIKAAFNNNDFQALKDRGLISNNQLKRYAVTFIANHDTNKNLPTDTSNPDYLHRTKNNVEEANAFLLSMPGTPCLFWAHFMHPAWHDNICRMILARRAAGVTNEATIKEVTTNGSNGIQWVVQGTKGTLLLQLGAAVNNGYSTSDYKEVFKSNVCRLCVSTDVASTVDFDNIYNNVKPQLINGYPVLSKPSGAYNTSVDVTVSPSSEGCTLVYSTNGNDPTATSKRITAATDMTFTETTDLRVGVLLNGEVVPTSIVRNTYVITNETLSTGSTKVYVYTTDNSTPYLYAWDDNNNSVLNGAAFPGWQLNYTKQIGGITWHEATVPASQFNMLLSLGGGSSQTHNINNVDHEVFYAFKDGIATDVTSTYIKALHNPIVSVDRASGSYTGNLTVNMTASVEGATIVYSVDQWETDIEDDNNRQSATFNTAYTFATNGTHLLRAAILKDGEIISKVARTYKVSGASGTASNAITIYVKNMTTTEAPHLYAWDNNQNALTGSWPGTQLSTTVSNSGQTWYKHTFNRNSVNLMFTLTGDKDKTSEINITAPGDYYYYYYPGAHSTGHAGYIDVTADSRHTTDKNTITLSFRNNDDAYIYAWIPSECFGKWPGMQFNTFPQTTSGWYYTTFVDVPNVQFKFAQGSSGGSTGDISVTSSHAYYYPQDGNNWGSAWDSSGDKITDRLENPVAEPGTVAPATLPSCATYVADAQYFYFENDWQMAVPSAWVWNGNKVYSGVTWPGEHLVDMVGVAPNGNAIYRWTHTGNDTPASIIFSDNGSNSTSTFAFTNGGYYTAEGLQGVVDDNVLTLGELIKSGNTAEEIVLSNDLDLIYFEGNSVYVKDLDGSANNPSVMQPGQKVYQSTAQYNHLRGNDDFDQSNWVKLVMPDGVSLTANYEHRSFMGQTLLGRLVDRTNPTVELTVRPIADFKKQQNYIPNVFTPANLNEQAEYFFPHPQPNEYCRVVWACYKGKDASGNLIFTMPAKEGGVNKLGIEGVITVTTEMYEGGDVPEFIPGEMYELIGVVKELVPAPTGAPRRATPQDIAPSTTYSLSMTSAVSQESVITIVQDIKPANAADVIAVKYYNVAGQASDRPFKGVNIVVKRHADGSMSTTKTVH